MKKYLVLLLSIAMVFSLAAVSMAEVKVTGDSTFTHDFSIYGESSSKIDHNLYFKGQVSDNVDWTLRFNMTNKKGDTGYYYPWVREAYSNIKMGTGNLKFGLYEVKPYSSIGILADNGDSAIGRMKDPFTIGFITPEFAPGVKASLYYFLDGASGLAGSTDWDTKQGFDDGAYVANLSYKNEKLFIDFYLVETNIDSYNMGYALNMKCNPIEPFTIGLNYGKRPGADGAQVVAEIVEFQYKQGPAYAKFGYDLNDGTDSLAPDLNRSAYSVGYEFNNKITCEFRSKDLKTSENPSKELRVMYKW